MVPVSVSLLCPDLCPADLCLNCELLSKLKIAQEGNSLLERALAAFATSGHVIAAPGCRQMSKEQIFPVLREILPG